MRQDKTRYGKTRQGEQIAANQCVLCLRMALECYQRYQNNDVVYWLPNLALQSLICLIFLEQSKHACSRSLTAASANVNESTKSVNCIKVAPPKDVAATIYSTEHFSYMSVWKRRIRIRPRSHHHHHLFLSLFTSNTNLNVAIRHNQQPMDSTIVMVNLSTCNQEHQHLIKEGMDVYFLL
ncbi:hypothetical protein BLOT_000292 [Blomia tropicalis]|nr:hypothetical protein BLOT_000292 [Blomia tropicalis]